MDTRLIRNHPLFPPILIGILSLLGICSILASAWLPKQNTQLVPTQTLTPFKYILLATETAVPSLESETTTSSRFLSTPNPGSGGGDIALTGQTADSANGDFFTPSIPTATSIGPTMQISERCTPPSAEFLDAVAQVVNSANPDNTLETAWMVQSTDDAELWMELWFVAARIHGPQIDAGSTPPAVWAVLFYSEGYFDVYSINDSATQYSDAAWGEGSDPPITMQMDGAQTAYDCSVGRG